tara:strand:+ start:1958 stop:2536 length:579 start_codon:yes stop_codon:yes gene_type:complete
LNLSARGAERDPSLLADLAHQFARPGQLVVVISPQLHAALGKHVFSAPVPTAGLGIKRFSRLFNPAITVDVNGRFLESSHETVAEDPCALELRFEGQLGSHNLCSEIPGGVPGPENSFLPWHSNGDRSHHHQITGKCVALKTFALKLLKNSALLIASLRQNWTISTQQSGIEIPSSPATSQCCVRFGWISIV